MRNLLSLAAAMAVVLGLAASAAVLPACQHPATRERERPVLEPAPPPRGLIVDERFDVARSIPAVATYEQLSTDLARQLEQGRRWHLVLDASSRAKAEIAGGVAALEIERAGWHWYSIQLAYLPVRLRPAMSYRVKFRACASRPLVTHFDLAHVGDGWRSYSGKRAFELAGEWREYEVRFETGRNDSEERARFEFNFGNEGRSTILPGDVIRIDEVQVIEEPSAAP